MFCQQFWGRESAVLRPGENNFLVSTRISRHPEKQSVGVGRREDPYVVVWELDDRSRPEAKGIGQHSVVYTYYTGRSF